MADTDRYLESRSAEARPQDGLSPAGRIAILRVVTPRSLKRWSRAARVAALGGLVLATGAVRTRPPATVAARTTVARADSLAATVAEFQGWKLYHANCDRCHGGDAIGSSFAPNLRHSVGPDGSLSRERFVETTTDGVVDKGMPAWKGALSRDQIEDIWAYVRARSSGRLAPGRPHVTSGVTRP